MTRIFTRGKLEYAFESLTIIYIDIFPIEGVPRKRREMKFRKRLRSEIANDLPEWEGEFMSYKELKKQLKRIAPCHEESKKCGKRPRLATEGGGNLREGTGFMILLDRELEKVNAFFIGKEEEYIIIMKELKNRVASMDCDGDTTQLKMDILNFHREMVSLLHYSVLNFAGYIKIMKKHKKKTASFSHLPFKPTVLQQPFFITDVICKFLKECEAMLNQLFLVKKP
ncbi:hypothetical protein F0562_023059 [Nyssa sinensis]|uniref:SPX domain-containing protein n=1 Tax=Nyssa sinensis TaxID=561372 RepID=A0A5J5BJC0_9ASTE|nr:hypothetical protein F0562_023059 [Nyssa sinensis]